MADHILHTHSSQRSFSCLKPKGLSIRMFRPGSWWRRCLCNCPSDALPCPRGKCCLPQQGDVCLMKRKEVIFYLLQDFDNNNRSDCIGFQVAKGISCPRQIRLKQSPSSRRRSHTSTSFLATTMSQRFLPILQLPFKI